LHDYLKEKGGEYVLDFRFRNDHDTRTRHFLIFVSKNPLGMKLMKSIMAKESSVLGSAVPSFEFNPGKEKKLRAKKEAGQGDLFAPDNPIDEIDLLADELITRFAGKSLTAEAVYHDHNVDRPYIWPNYQAALGRLEEAGRVTCNPSATQRKRIKGKLTLPDTVLIMFPEK